MYFFWLLESKAPGLRNFRSKGWFAQIPGGRLYHQLLGACICLWSREGWSLGAAALVIDPLPQTVSDFSPHLNSTFCSTLASGVCQGVGTFRWRTVRREPLPGGW